MISYKTVLYIYIYFFSFEYANSFVIYFFPRTVEKEIRVKNLR